ncbi:MAG: deoxyribonuclease IV [Candidatus Micrarchaeia archaeon]
MHSIRFGFHLSTKGSILNAARVSKEQGYGAYQLFISNPRSWRFKTLTGIEAERFALLNKEYDTIAFAHMPYLCNLASPNNEVFEKSITLGIENINACNRLGIDNIVFHVGSHLGHGYNEGLIHIEEALSRIIENTQNCTILLENSAGYKNSIGSSIGELAQIINDLKSERIGVCIDTCHLFAAGYDLRNMDKVKKLESEFDQKIGSKKLKLIHLNDSKFPLQSGLDRHWHIGEGYIGKEGFINFFSTKLFHNGPYILETPYKNEYSEKIDITNAIKFYKEAQDTYIK